MKINNITMQIKEFIIHQVGNKLRNEGCIIAKTPHQCDEKLKGTLKKYFSFSFKYDNLFCFNHKIALNMNENYVCISEIFDNSAILHSQSINLAKHLYEKSNHPKIKGGEFYVVYFEDCVINGKTVDAVGLFKSENKDTFLKVYPSGDNFEIESQQGVNINKLDKGAIIFNTERENGYVVAVVDNTNKGAEARYWVDEFLHVKQRQDAYYNTQNVITLAKNFLSKELPKKFNTSKADQADLINKTVKFFKENDSFDMNDFANEVIEQPELIDSFRQYKEKYASKHDIQFADRFAISDSAIKKNTRSLKSVIKLDKNFLIHIQGDRSKLEQGEDAKGTFYKMYYKEEQ